MTTVIREDDMTVPDPSGQPDVERPTGVPGRDGQVKPAPTPEHHPDDGLGVDDPDPLATEPPRTE
jgi:hypothetical protein